MATEGRLPIIRGGGDGDGGGGETGRCGVCGVRAPLSCSGCSNIHYCGKDHQRQHWPEHKQQCQNYNILSTPQEGKFLVSSRRMAGGHLIMEDVPLIVGPMANSDLICLGCHTLISNSEPEIPRCSKCYWPVCSPTCAVASHHQYECSTLALDTRRIGPPKQHGETPRYDSVFLIRCLLLRSTNPSAWETLLDMAHHSEQRQQKEELHQIVSVRYVTEILKLDYTAEIVHQVKGAISTNAMEIRSENNASVRAMYPRLRLFNHSCVPNVHLSCGTRGVMQVRTAVSVQAKEPLNICYTGTTLPLWERQLHLSTMYHFSCDCRRCADPTELGTYFSCPKCLDCKSCYFQPSTWLGVTLWICSNCKMEKTSQQVQEEIQEWLQRIEMDDVFGGCSIKQIQNVLRQIENDFHPQHFMWMKAAQLVLYRLIEINTQKALELRSKIWQKLMAVYSKLEPGVTRRRGMTLLETAIAMLEAAKSEHAEGDHFLPEFVKKLQPVVAFLDEAAQIFSLEAPGSREAPLALRSKQKKAEAEQFLASLGYGVLRAE